MVKENGALSSFRGHTLTLFATASLSSLLWAERASAQGRPDVLGISIGTPAPKVTEILEGRTLKLHDGTVRYKIDQSTITLSLIPNSGEFVPYINAESLTPPTNFDDPRETIRVEFYKPPSANGVDSLKRHQSLGSVKVKPDELKAKLLEKYGPFSGASEGSSKLSYIWFWTPEGKLHPTKPSGTLNYAVSHPCFQKASKDPSCGDSLMVDAGLSQGMVDSITTELFNKRAAAAATDATSQAISAAQKGTVGTVPDL